jgi:hypothetical protein
VSKALARLTLVLAFSSTGCLSQQVARDGTGSRQAILDIYTDQIMDNLVRARTGQPFVQLTFRDILVQDTDTCEATVQNTYTNEATRNANGLGLTSGIVAHYTNALLGIGHAKRDRTISFKADPVTDKNDIYEYYLAFANDPTLFVEIDSKPTFPVHIYRKCDKKYYYVPIEAAGVFQQLALKTTFMRGPEKAASADYFEATIANAKVEKQEMGIDYGWVIFDHPVKNDEGYMLVTLPDKRQVRIRLHPLTRNIPMVGNIVPIGNDTTAFEIEWNSTALKVTDENLKNAKAKIFLQNYFPPPPPTNPDLQRLNDSLDQIRLNTLNQSLRP